MFDRLRRLSASVDPWMALTLLLTVFAWAALLSPGYFFKAHDARHSVFFLVEFDAAIRDGAWWPRWTMDQALGYGYPLWIFYSPLSYYVAEAFHLLGLGFTAAVKATYVVGFLGAAVGMFAMVRRWWGRGAALVAALVYTYAPYHLVDIYVRSALAEFMAFVWFPWAVLAFDLLIVTGRRRYVAWAALAFAAIALTHAVTAVVFIPALALMVLAMLVRAHWRDRRTFLIRAGQAFAAAVLGLAIGAIFLGPMLLERPFIVQEQWVHDTYQYRHHFVYWHQFFSPLWNFLYSVPGPKDGMSFQLGLMPAWLAMAAVAGALARQAHRGWVLFLAALLLVLLIFMTATSQPVWDAVSLLQLVQFPWRILAPVVFLLAILSGAAVALLDGEGDLGALAVAILVIAGSLAYVRPQLTPVTPADESAHAIYLFETTFPDMVGMTAWSAELPKDSPLVQQWREGRPFDQMDRIGIIEGQGMVETIRIGGASVEGRVVAEGPVRVQFYTYWFPGWTAYVDGEAVPASPEGPHGLITFDVPAGEHHVAIRMRGTPMRNISAIVSAVSLLLVVAIGWLPWRRS